jgi:hypothetical protein
MGRYFFVASEGPWREASLRKRHGTEKHGFEGRLYEP